MKSLRSTRDITSRHSHRSGNNKAIDVRRRGESHHMTPATLKYDFTLSNVFNNYLNDECVRCLPALPHLLAGVSGKCLGYDGTARELHACRVTKHNPRERRLETSCRPCVRAATEPTRVSQRQNGCPSFRMRADSIGENSGINERNEVKPSLQNNTPRYTK